MQKNNRSLSKSAAVLLIAIVAFLNASCSTKISTKDYLIIPAAVASDRDNIQPLKIGVLPTQSLAEQQRMIEPLDKYLEKCLKTAFLNIPEGIEDIFGGQSAGYTSVEDADYTPIRKLRAKLSLKSERVR